MAQYLSSAPQSDSLFARKGSAWAAGYIVVTLALRAALGGGRTDRRRHR
jgi:hypothetical protein